MGTDKELIKHWQNILDRTLYDIDSENIHPEIKKNLEEINNNANITFSLEQSNYILGIYVRVIASRCERTKNSLKKANIILPDEEIIKLCSSNLINDFLQIILNLKTN